jgi:hypothetical protein
MSFDLHIPENSERGLAIQRIVEADQATPEEVLERLVDQGLKLALANKSSDHTLPRRSYSSLFGAAAGPGTHGSRESVDQYLSELRNEW